MNATLKFRSYYRSNRPEVFYKIGVLESLAKFTTKDLFQGLIF